MAKSKKSASETALGYQAQLWLMADALRNTMEAAESKHVVSGRFALSCVWAAARSVAEMTRSSIGSPLREWPTPVHPTQSRG